jgi:hypothetical protein
MPRLALAVAVIAVLACSGAGAQEAAPPAAPTGPASEAPPPGAPTPQAPGAPAPQAPGYPGGQQAGWASVQAACQQDLAQFCNGIKPGGGRVRACIKQHFRQMSPDCKQAIRQAKQSQ